MGKLFIYIMLLAGVTGCSPQLFEGMKTGLKQNISKESLYPFFDITSNSTHLFNMRLSYKGNDVDGFLAIKYQKEGSARAIYTSIPGMTIFDFELSATDFKVHRCIEPMRKKVVLNLFKKDFSTLFLYNVPAKFKAKAYQDGDGKLGYRVKTADGKAYFLTDIHSKEQLKVQLPGIVTLLNITYQSFENSFPKHISITHPKLKLSMQLEKAR